MMDPELRAYLEGMEGRLNARIDASIETSEGRVNARIDVLSTTFSDKLDRAAEAFASEIGILHEQIKALDRSVRRQEGTITSVLELVVKQSRWHEETDNAARELGHRMTQMERRIGDLERRLPPAA